MKIFMPASLQNCDDSPKCRTSARATPTPRSIAWRKNHVKSYKHRKTFRTTSAANGETGALTQFRDNRATVAKITEFISMATRRSCMSPSSLLAIAFSTMYTIHCICLVPFTPCQSASRRSQCSGNCWTLRQYPMRASCSTRT